MVVVGNVSVGHLEPVLAKTSLSFPPFPCRFLCGFSLLILYMVLRFSHLNFPCEIPRTK